MKIYTKTGDAGTTMLFGGGRVPKYHLRIETYGTVDELNSFIGLLRDQDIKNSHKKFLVKTQEDLFTLGSILALNPDKKNAKPPKWRSAAVKGLERRIDRMEGDLEPLSSFILPGGNTVVSYCHLARCVCRRCERLCVLLNENEKVPAHVLTFLNRLSDYLFVLARALANESGAEEIPWKSR